MGAGFDPYLKWLSIPIEEQPPDHYRLLGAPRFCNDADVIDNAADRQMAHLRKFSSGANGALAERLLNEIAAARLCLLQPDQKKRYDAELRAQEALTQPLDLAAYPTSSQAGRSIPVPLPPAAPARTLPPPKPLLKEPPAPPLNYKPLILAGGGVALFGLLVVLGLTLGGSGGAPPAPVADAATGAQTPVRVETRPQPDRVVIIAPEESQRDEPEEEPEDEPEIEEVTPTPAPPVAPPVTPPASTTTLLPPVPSPNSGAPYTGSPSTGSPPGGGYRPPPVNTTTPDPGQLPPNVYLDPVSGQLLYMPGGRGRRGRPVRFVQRGPAPSEEALKKARLTLREFMEADFAEAQKKPDERRRVADKLLDMHYDTEGAERYVLCDEARRLAIEAAEASVAIRAIEALASAFEVNANALKRDALSQMAKKAKKESQHRRLATEAGRLAAAALETGDAKAAQEFNAIYASTAKKSKDSQLIKLVPALAKQVAEYKKVQDGFEAAEQKLAEDADNGPANLAVGKYYCIVRRDWTRGLPHLALGSDEEVRAAAVADLAAENTPPAWVERGDAWYELSRDAREFEPRMRWWYERALPHIQGLERQKMERRISDMRQSSGSSGVGEKTTYVGGSVVTSPGGSATVPSETPPKYDASEPYDAERTTKLVTQLRSDAAVVITFDKGQTAAPDGHVLIASEVPEAAAFGPGYQGIEYPFVPGIAGQALHSGVKIPATGAISLSANKEFAIGFWARPAAVGEGKFMALLGAPRKHAKHTMLGVRTNELGEWTLDFGGDAILSARQKADDHWRHHAADYDGKQVRYFIDGLLVGQRPAKIELVAPALTFGERFGWLDELILLPRRLAPGEPEALFRHGRAGLRLDEEHEVPDANS